ncbi:MULTISPECIES: archaellin/type IV pilin N-terminal domain-containing protein [Halomicrobium]|uniref:Flagellin n=2 Tax=Halomicrobium mukohataei TaxID=57705 RepID=C7NYR4_HALMD|nr:MULTISPECIES: archaellin/type IV pilin N-terminal domain-containing protein [Halomicrobium]ACV48603.1 flagellin [Halomicrobium mukohataei DSM 12286]QCD67000.1 flagellin [Halomicrobium mukohataei]QFR21810.1 flagellin [Halomicrobium sp. ZPS1]
MQQSWQRDRAGDRGQVGIGTLIVFIAMVLVAAIAAGVLINTAGFLQTNAEQSGQQSSQQVTNRLQVVDIAGSDIVKDGEGFEVTTVDVTVKRAPGSGNVDLSTTTAQWVSSGGSYNVLSYTAAEGSGGSSGDAGFITSTLQDDDGSISNSNALNDQADRAIIRFQTDSVPTSEEEDDLNGKLVSGDLTEGSSAEIRLTTQAGGETTATVVVPESLSGKSAVSL